MARFVQKLLLASAAVQAASAVTLSVSTSGGNASSPLLYGYMFEDINNSGDGGIHGQVLKNNGFQPGTSTSLTAYAAVGGSTLSIDTANPLTTAITSTLKVTNPSSNTGTVGFSNSGYNGVPVDQATYTSSVWIKGTYSGKVTFSLVGSDGTVFGSAAVDVSSTASKFTQHAASIAVTQSSAAKTNVWQLTYDAAAATDGYLYFGLPQLFPPTYKGRTNGLRNDVASFLEAVGGSFLRWPGGNNLEGDTVATRWAWNATIGPVEQRRGHKGTWSYVNTDALGLLEHLYWAQDMGLANVLAVWAGHSLDGTVLTGDALAPYVDDILNELEFVLGDAATTTYGALRAQYGQTAPFVVDMIEVGNEEDLSKGCSTYASRFTQIYNAIHAAYPDITVIAATNNANCLPSTLPAGVWTDEHHYLRPDQFVALFNEWDNQSRDHPIFVGEYASTTGNDGSTTYWSNLVGSCAEAVYMIGLERNSDVVKMASFAPLLEHFDLAEWSPDLFGLDSSSGSLAGSTSYYVQQLFASYRGQTIKPVTADAAFGPVYWVASATTDGRRYIVKLANYGTTAQNVTVQVPGASLAGEATLHLLSGDPKTSNYPHSVTISPKTSTVSGSAEKGFALSLPPYAVAVLVLGN